MIVLAIVFAVLFALPELTAVSNLVELPQYYDLLGIGASTPWPLLVLGVALPPVLYVVALLLARRRRTGSRMLILVAALAVTNALSFSAIALAGALQPALG